MFTMVSEATQLIFKDKLSDLLSTLSTLYVQCTSTPLTHFLKNLYKLHVKMNYNKSAPRKPAGKPPLFLFSFLMYYKGTTKINNSITLPD